MPRIPDKSDFQVVKSKNLSKEEKIVVTVLTDNWHDKRIVKQLSKDLYRTNFAAFSHNKWVKNDVEIIKNFNLRQSGSSKKFRETIEGGDFNVVLTKFTQTKMNNPSIKIWLCHLYKIDFLQGTQKFYASFVWCEKFRFINPESSNEELKEEEAVPKLNLSNSPIVSQDKYQETNINQENSQIPVFQFYNKINQYDDLQNQYNILFSQHNILLNHHLILQNHLENLQNQYHNLQNRYYNLQNQYYNSQNQYCNSQNVLPTYSQVVYSQASYLPKTCDKTQFCSHYLSTN